MHFFFAYYPYICITLLLAGLAFRYVTDPGDWNARSSEIFEKTWLRRGSIIFHYAIILSFSLGILWACFTPDSVMHALRISRVNARTRGCGGHGYDSGSAGCGGPRHPAVAENHKRACLGHDRSYGRAGGAAHSDRTAVPGFIRRMWRIFRYL